MKARTVQFFWLLTTIFAVFLANGGSAGLSQADIQTGKSANGASATAASGGAENIARGRDLFERRCTGCHSLTKDGEGPRLGDVYGRKAGSVPTFQYSPAMQRANIVWNDATLDKWLTDPDMLVPGTEMDFSIPKAQERQEIIRFLKSRLTLAN